MVTVGIIGAGRIGKVHTQSICNYIRSARIKTVADPFMNEATEKWLLSMGVDQCHLARYSTYQQCHM